MTYHRVCNQINTTGTTSGEGTAYPSKAPEFNHGFQWGSCYSIFSFTCMFCRSLFVLLAIVLSPLSLWYLQTLLTLVFGNLFFHLYISASLQIWPKYIFNLVCLYLHKCHSLWSSFAFLRSQMGGFAHFKTWFNQPFLQIYLIITTTKPGPLQLFQLFCCCLLILSVLWTILF